VKHGDFVREYAASIDRMMASTASKLDLSDDFIPAWKLLTALKTDDFAKVVISKLPSGMASHDPRIGWGSPEPRSITYGANSFRDFGPQDSDKIPMVRLGISKETYDLAVKYGARPVPNLF